MVIGRKHALWPMSILKSVNKLRRSFMSSITRRLGVTRIKRNGTEVSIKTILVVRPNHRLGNLLLITPLLQEIKNTFPRAKVDLFIKGSVAPVLFRNYDNVNRIIALPKRPQKDILKFIRGWMATKINHYDLVINAIHSSSSGKLSAHFANAKFRFLGEINEEVISRYADYQHMGKLPVYSFRYFVKMLGFTSGNAAVPPLDLKLTESEIAEGKQLLRQLLKNDKRTIGIYTYATGQKCYPPAWWNAFYRLLKETFPEHNIVEVLPIEHVSQISFKAPSFYSKKLREIASLVSNMDVFIGADSGMMHLASASRTPVVGLFKAKNINQYAPYNDKSVGVRTDCMNQLDIIRLVEQAIAVH